MTPDDLLTVQQFRTVSILLGLTAVIGLLALGLSPRMLGRKPLAYGVGAFIAGALVLFASSGDSPSLHGMILGICILVVVTLVLTLIGIDVIWENAAAKVERDLAAIDAARPPSKRYDPAAHPQPQRPREEPHP